MFQHGRAHRNRQVGDLLAYAGHGGHEFRTKSELPRVKLTRVLDAGVPAAWVFADEVSGGDRRRIVLEARVPLGVDGPALRLGWPGCRRAPPE